MKPGSIEGVKQPAITIARYILPASWGGDPMPGMPMSCNLPGRWYRLRALSQRTTTEYEVGAGGSALQPERPGQLVDPVLTLCRNLPTVSEKVDDLSAAAAQHR